jgi:hypothetical protein
MMVRLQRLQKINLSDNDFTLAMIRAGRQPSRISRMKFPGTATFIVGLIFLFVSAVFIVHEFTRLKVRTAGELSVINGQIASYSFKDGLRGSHFYLIRFLRYRATFQIPVDFVGCFSRASFQSDLSKGDSVWVSIPEASEGSLQLDERIPVFAVRTKTVTYLDEQDTLKIYNSDIPIILSLALFMVGASLIMWRPADDASYRRSSVGD